MLTQKLVTNLHEQSGVLTITAAPGAVAELIGLAEELALRSTIVHESTIHHLTEDPLP